MKRTSLKSAIVLIALALVFVSVIGCNEAPAQAPAAAPASAPKPSQAPAAAPAPAPKPSQAPSPTQAAPQTWEFPKSVKIAAPPGASTAISEGLASFIKKELGVPATTGSGQSTAMVAGLSTKELDIAIASADVMAAAVKGTAVFKEKGKQPVRLLMTASVSCINLATWRGSGLKTFKDVKGKRFMYEWLAAPYNTAIGDRLLEVNKMARNDVKVLPIGSTADAMSALKGKTTDLLLHPGSKAGISYWMELVMTTDIDFVSLTKEEQAYVIEKEPYLTYQTLPAKIYKGQDSDITGVGNKMIYAVYRETNDDFVYKLMKVLLDDVGLDKPGRFVQFHPDNGSFTLNLAITAAGAAPFHAGAVKYYKERGVWTPQLEEIQKKLLAEAGDSR